MQECCGLEVCLACVKLTLLALADHKQRADRPLRHILGDQSVLSPRGLRELTKACVVLSHSLRITSPHQGVCYLATPSP